jgi:hypothetical protein
VTTVEPGDRFAGHPVRTAIAEWDSEVTCEDFARTVRGAFDLMVQMRGRPAKTTSFHAALVMTTSSQESELKQEETRLWPTPQAKCVFELEIFSDGVWRDAVPTTIDCVLVERSVAEAVEKERWAETGREWWDTSKTYLIAGPPAPLSHEPSIAAP